MAPGNALPLHGNEKTMNLNSLVLANIQASPYFKVHLYELKTYHQVIDEIYYKVNHLEPWEKGSRKTAGQTGMCGGVRGVGTGGIVSSAYCLLYKLYTLKLTRKQLIGLCSHSDSSFIRALGLMYIRYTQPPNTFWDWYEPYLDDDEEVDPKAGGGNNMTIGEMSEQLLVKLEWYGTLFPRIPVPVQKDIENKLRMHKEQRGNMARQARLNPERDYDNVKGASGTGREGNDLNFGEAERMSRLADRESTQRSMAPPRSPKRERDASLPSVHRQRTYSRSRSRGRRSRSRGGRKRSRDRRERSRDRSKEKKKESRRRSRSGERKEKHKHKSSKHRSRSKNGSKERHKKSKRSSSRSRRDEEKKKKTSIKDSDEFQRDLKREMERVKQSKNGTDRD